MEDRLKELKKTILNSESYPYPLACNGCGKFRMRGYKAYCIDDFIIYLCKECMENER